MNNLEFPITGDFEGFKWHGLCSQGVLEIKANKLFGDMDRVKRWGASFEPFAMYDGDFSSKEALNDAIKVLKFFGEKGYIFARVLGSGGKAYDSREYITNLPKELEGVIKGVLTGISNRIDIGYKKNRKDRIYKIFNTIFSVLLIIGGVVLSIVSAGSSLIGTIGAVSSVISGVAGISANIVKYIYDNKIQEKMEAADKKRFAKEKLKSQRDDQVVNSLISEPQSIYPQGYIYEAQRPGSQSFSPQTAYDPNKGILGSFQTNRMDEIIYNRAHIDLGGNIAYASTLLQNNLKSFTQNKKMLNHALKEQYKQAMEFVNGLSELLMDTYAKYDKGLASQVQIWQNTLLGIKEKAIISFNSQFENNYAKGLRFDNSNFLASIKTQKSQIESSRDDVNKAYELRDLALSPLIDEHSQNIYKYEFIKAYLGFIKEFALRQVKVYYKRFEENGQGLKIPIEGFELKDSGDGFMGFNASWLKRLMDKKSEGINLYIFNNIKIISRPAKYITDRDGAIKDFRDYDFCISFKGEVTPLDIKDEAIKNLIRSNDFTYDYPAFTLKNIYDPYIIEAKELLDYLAQETGFKIDDFNSIYKGECAEWVKKQAKYEGGFSLGDKKYKAKKEVIEKIKSFKSYKDRDSGYEERRDKGINKTTKKRAFKGVSKYALATNGELESMANGYDTSYYKTY